jgi:serine/threonine-protein kinase HipA
MSFLIVYLNATKVGRLEQDDGGLLRFSYDPSWLANPDAIPLSRSLPLQAETFAGKKARPFFAGILPEEEPRKQIARILGISDTNDFAMLAGIGGECAGAVSLLAEDAAPAVPGAAEHRQLSERELEQIVAELPRRPLLAGRDGLRLSLAGAQDKLPVIVRDGGICLPLGNTPSTHILKPEPDRFPGLAANEVFCMALAGAVGLNVPHAEYRQIADKACILVERYDRRTDSHGQTVRIHQEDFCQAMGFPPERKYQSEGGPTLRDCTSLLRDWSSAPALDIPAFIGGLIFNVLVGNADAHAKNYSLLYADGSRRMSPFYDLVSTLAWPELSKKLAMKIGGCESTNVFSMGDWKRMAKETGLGWPLVRERIGETCTAVMNELDAVQMRAGDRYKETVARLCKMMRQRSDKMRAGLAEQGL